MTLPLSLMYVLENDHQHPTLTFLIFLVAITAAVARPQSILHTDI